MKFTALPTRTYSRSFATVVKLLDVAEDLEAKLSLRVGGEEAATWCEALWIALAQIEEVVRELDQLDALELDAPGHRDWRPFPEV